MTISSYYDNICSMRYKGDNKMEKKQYTAPNEVYNTIELYYRMKLFPIKVFQELMKLFNQYDNTYQYYKYYNGENLLTINGYENIIETSLETIRSILLKWIILPNNLAIIAENYYKKGTISYDDYYYLLNRIEEYRMLFAARENGEYGVVPNLRDIIHEFQEVVSLNMGPISVV